ncbi:hypothetical protein AH333_004010 [Salmonella enterica subsp. salamae]|nr:hypothetical protein [Salmonella enterica subsp. salamae]
MPLVSSDTSLTLLPVVSLLHSWWILSLTAAPFRGLPQPEAHYRSGFNADLVRNSSA